MKRNLLFVVNLNDKLCANARASFTDASQRWGFDYLEIRCPMLTGYTPSFQKLFAFSRMDYELIDTVVHFDADMLIRSDAPSPQEVFGPGIHMGLDKHPTHSPAVLVEVLKEVHAAKFWPLYASDPLKRTTYEEYMAVPRNAGFIVVKMPAPVEVFAEMLTLLPPPDTRWALNGHYEQAITNYCTCKKSQANLIADNTWNWRSPPEGPMHAYAYHYTGWGYTPDLRERIKTFDWRVVKA